ncbi:oxidoreductase [Streptomyces venezuelae]|uniref:oxidoreductase n=1 Tax=Streptomyces venezuelae TaxID=54571 RepID=UPI0037D7046E
MTKKQRWTADRIPDQTGRVFVVTGANSGLGLATTRELARRGARVVLAVRDEEKGRRAVEELAASGVRPGLLDVRPLDLADLDSVRAFADRMHTEHTRLDVLVNNAGVMAPPRTLSPQGHEVQFATNHLGHFALTGLLLDLLAAGRGPRVVALSSIKHRQGSLRLDDLTGERGYTPMGFYNQSKFANTVFGLELHRRLTAAGSPVAAVLAHPGYTATRLQTRDTSGLKRWVFHHVGNPYVAQRPEQGALPQLYAATEPGVVGGEFIGPGGMAELRGAPVRVRPTAAAADPATGRRLWELSERLTGVGFPVTASSR